MRSLLPFLAPVGIIVPVWIFGSPEAPFASLVLLGLLCYLAMFDQKHLRLPDHATLPMAVLGVVVTWQNWPSLLTTHVLSAVVACGVLWSLSTIWWRIRKIEALGLGDVKFATAAALWIGPAVSIAIIVAASSALMVALSKMVLGKASMREPIPFGPFLCFGLWTVWCWFTS